MFVLWLVCGVLRFVPGSTGRFFAETNIWMLLVLLGAAVPLGVRFLNQNILWSVRNRLTVTYLLMGLAPLVLLATLAGLAAYVFTGQFAIFAVTSVVDTELAQLTLANRSLAGHAAFTLQSNPRAKVISLPEMAAHRSALQESALGTNTANSLTSVALFLDGVELPIKEIKSSGKITLPHWINKEFTGIVVDNGHLYARSVYERELKDGHKLTSISSSLIGQDSMEKIANGLGRVILVPSFDFNQDSPSVLPSESDPGVQPTKPARFKRGVQLKNEVRGAAGEAVIANRDGLREDERNPDSIGGGKLPPSSHFYDVPVAFWAPLKMRDWSNGNLRNIRIDVYSRPGLLYRRLFVASLTVATIVQDVLVGIAVFFALIELVAFIMALRLSRTITRSVHDLYDATDEIDRGNFTHRIPIRRKDQLGALSTSFNVMSASLERLLEEQREKERLQSELAIAQEVQNNLFPQGDMDMPGLELCGICRPARTVSGDYYDFIRFGKYGMGLALGDISGKGISAALLMATLHSAVRAYRFAGEELTFALPQNSRAGLQQAEDELDCGVWFEEPGRILGLLNRHLYSSTQPEKYATLFLGHYESRTRKLIYSNGGQLPPLILHGDDRITRLDCGGTVVGLLDGMIYQQDSVTLAPGDILVAYSDGVTEPENEFGDFGEERLMEIVRRHRHRPVRQITDHVMQALRNWIGNEEQPDDITLVLARQQ